MCTLAEGTGKHPCAFPPEPDAKVPAVSRLGPAEEQQRVCREQRVAPAPPSDDDKAGIALATLDQVPLNGLRHQPEAGTSGWYIWGGTTMNEAANFFDPLHHKHMPDYCPAALPFLALPPGWRFLVAPGQVDVWFDPELLKEGER